MPSDRAPTRGFHVSRRSAGAPCGWAYCSKWAALVVERVDERGDVERMWVCLTHEVHAHVRGWVTAPKG
jgi:hypothetical protein